MAVLNLFFGADEDEEWISEVHQEAFENPDCLGLYYIYTKLVYKALRSVKHVCRRKLWRIFLSTNINLV